MTSATVAPAGLDSRRGAPGNSATSERGRWTIAGAAGADAASRRQPTTAASTDQIGGRLSAISDQVRPSSALPYSWPVLVPK